LARQTDIRIRRSAVSGAIPLPANLNLGELALNTADGKAYMKKSIGGVDTVIEIGSGDPGSIYSSFEMFEYTAQVANQTTFSGADQNSNTLDYNTGSGTNLPQVQVYLNGILLDYGTDFTATNGSSVVFSVAVSAGDLIQIAAYKSNVTVTADLDLADNQKILLGDDDDLEIYHDGLKSIINDTGTGNLQFQIGGTEIFESTSDGIVLADGLDVEATEFIGDLRGSVLFKAQAGEALSKGDVVTITGISGNTTVVSKADANDASLMPAFGVAAETVSINVPVDIYSFGIMSNLTTNINGWTEGSPLYVSTIPGEMTDVPPSGSASLVQQIAKITKVHPSTGSIDITGAGRANATPNLDEGKIFVGNSSNRSVQVDDTIHVDMANSRVGIGTDSPSDALHISRATFPTLKLEDTGLSSNLILQTHSGSSEHRLTGTGAYPLVFKTNDIESMRLDSSGNLLVGTTDTSLAANGAGGAEGVMVAPDHIQMARSGNAGLFINRMDSNGTIAEFRFNGNVVGSIESRSNLVSTIILDPRTNGAGLTGATNRIDPTDGSGVQTDGVCSLGRNTERFKDLYLSAGAYASFIAGQNDTNTSINFPGSDVITFNNGGSEAARIDSAGSLFVGSTFYAGNSASATGSGLSDGYLWSTRQANTAAIFNRLSTDGDIVQLRKDGGTVGSIGTTSDRLTIGSGDTGLRFVGDANQITPWNTSTNAISDNLLDLGNTNNRFKDLHLSGTANVGPVISTVVNTGDATLLTLHHDTGADLAQQKSFIDFSFEDDNSNETPQVRIGAEVGQNNNADTQEKEGSGAFVVYTNNADTTAGAAGTSLAERMRVDYQGNVGIGTTSPAQKLHVIGSGRFRSAASGLGSFIAVGNQTETAGNYSAYYFGNTSNDTGYFKGGIAYETLSTTHGRGDMHFLQRSDAGGGNADISHSVMTILNSGSVGIGTRTPDGLLHVQHTSVNSPIIVANRYNDTSTGTDFRPIFAVSEADLFSTGSTATIIGNHNRTIHLGSLYGVDGTASANSNCLTILAGGNVGIGTDSPSQKLHIADSGNAVVLIEAGNTSGSYVNFADTDDTNVGQIQYDHSSNFMAFRTNNSERMRIDLLGNLFVGSTFYAGNSASATGSGLSDGYLWSTRQANTAAIFNRLSTDGDIVQLRKDGGTVGSIGTTSDRLTIGSGDTGLRFVGDANQITPWNTSTNAISDNLLDLGNTNNRFKDLHLSGTANVGPVISTVVNTGDATLLTLHHDTGADLAQQKSFIDFSFEDDNSNETPQVRIGAEVGQNNNADTQEKEGSGAFVVYTNNADTTAGAAGTSLAERMRVDYQGNVGIGTTSPAQKLHVIGSGRFRSAASGLGSFIAVGNQTETAGNYSAYYFGNTSNDTGYFKGGIAYETLSTTHGRGDMHFLQRSDAGGGNADISHSVMTILNSGSVGIGTRTPDGLLHVQHTSVNSPIIVANRYNDTSTGTDFRPIFAVSEADLFSTGSTATIIGNHNRTIHLGSLYGVDGTASANSNCLTILAGGNVGIGTNAPKAKLQVEEYGVDTTVTSTAAITQVAIHTFPIADFRSAKCTIQVTNTTDSTYHITEMLMIHNGTTVSITEYGTVYTGSTAEATFDADISSTNLRLLATPATTDGMTFKVVCHSITV